jgi:hypothetical protein
MRIQFFTRNIFYLCFIFLFIGMLFPVHIFAVDATINSNTWVTDNYPQVIMHNQGYTYLGGSFTYVGPPTGSGVIVDASSGAITQLTDKVNGYIDTAVSDGSGGWYIGGGFTKVGSTTRNNIAHILANGTVDTNWDVGNTGANGNIQDMAIDNSGTNLYVSGAFTSIGGLSRNFIAKIKISDATVVSSWNADVSSTCGTQNVGALALNADDSILYFGGCFNSVKSQTRIGIAAVNTSDSTINSWYPTGGITGSGFAPFIYDILFDGDRIFIGGSFDTVRGSTRNDIASLDLAGNLLSFTADTDGAVFSIARDSNTIFLGGNFMTINSTLRARFAAVNRSTGVLTTPDMNLAYETSNIVESIAISGGSVFVGGDFTKFNTIAKRNTVSFNLSDNSLTSWTVPTSERVLSFRA